MQAHGSRFAISPEQLTSLFAHPLVLSAARVRESCFLVLTSIARFCRAGAIRSTVDVFLPYLRSHAQQSATGIDEDQAESRISAPPKSGNKHAAIEYGGNSHFLVFSLTAKRRARTCSATSTSVSGVMGSWGRLPWPPATPARYRPSPHQATRANRPVQRRSHRHNVRRKLGSQSSLAARA